MRQLIKIKICCLGVVCFALVFCANENSVSAQTPNLEELCQNWAHWVEDLRSFSPRMTKSVLTCPPMLDPVGHSTREMTSYVAPGKYWALELNYRGEKSLNVVNFHRSELMTTNGCVLKGGNEGWYLSQRIHREMEIWKAPLGMAETIPGMPEGDILRFDTVFNIERVDEECKSGIQVYRFKVKKPVEQAILLDFPSVDFVSVVVHFSEEIGWLPQAMILEIENNFTGDGFRWKLTHENWKEVDGNMIPFAFEIAGVDEVAEPYRVELTDVAKCSLAEVESRCHFDFYKLPPLNDSSSGNSFNWVWWVVLFAVITVSSFVLKRQFFA